MRRFVWSLLAATATIAAPRAARADEVVFADGTRQTGCVVTEETHAVVAYTIPLAGQSSGVRQQRKASEVREVIYEEPPAALRRGLALLEYGEQERALEAFQEAQAAGPARLRQHAFAHAARCQLALGDGAGARATLEALLKAVPSTRFLAEARLGLVRAHVLAGDLTGARAALTAAEQELRAKQLGAAATVGLELERARLSSAAKDWDKAAEGYRRVTSDRSSPEELKLRARVGLAEALAQGGDLKAAGAELAPAIRKADELADPVAARAFAVLGDVRKAEGQRRQAALAYLRAFVFGHTDGAARAGHEAAKLIEADPELGGKDRADEIRYELASRWPRSEWAKKR